MVAIYVSTFSMRSARVRRFDFAAITAPASLIPPRTSRGQQLPIVVPPLAREPGASAFELFSIRPVNRCFAAGEETGRRENECAVARRSDDFRRLSGGTHVCEQRLVVHRIERRRPTASNENGERIRHLLEGRSRHQL